jgi:hypothetical protein
LSALYGDIIFIDGKSFFDKTIDFRLSRERN